MKRLLAVLLALLAGPGLAQTPAAGGADADAAYLEAADAARTLGAGPGGALDPALPTIHEFVDFACPVCRDAFLARHDSLEAAFVATGRANLVVRAFPIPRLLRGPHAAEAALCAGALGGAEAFGHMQRRLYKAQADWRFLRDPTPAFRDYAAEAGLDAAAFADCLARDAVAPLLVADVRLGARLGATGTPTFAFVAPGATEPADLFYGNEPLARFEQALARIPASP
ncbi:MAG: DsbA family protein [Rubricoccaceae bacterium]